MIPRYSTRVALALVLSASAACNTAGGSSSEQTNGSVYRDIRSVTIQNQAKAAAGTDPQVCSAFRLSEEQVREFVRAAREVDVRSYAADLEYAPCSVEGSLTLNNGLDAKWEIEMSRRGRVVFEDEHIMLLHCPGCGGPFAQ
jgi:hypothetical protein